MNLVYSDEISLLSDKKNSLGLQVTFSGLLDSSDIVIPLLPLTDRTFHLFDRNALVKMKKSNYLVNACRGSVIDEMAVVESLEKRRLAGYAADVFEMEDWIRPDRPRSIPKALLENTAQTFFTPHLGSAVDDVRIEIERYCARSILQALDGKIPEGKVNDVC